MHRSMVDITLRPLRLGEERKKKKKKKKKEETTWQKHNNVHICNAKKTDYMPFIWDLPRRASERLIADTDQSTACHPIG